MQGLAETIQHLRQSQQTLAAEYERLREGQAGVQALAQSVGELAQSLKRDTTDRKILMDTNGLGRPEVFDNEEERQITTKFWKVVWIQNTPETFKIWLTSNTPM